MQCDNVFYNGKAETGSARLLGTTLIHTVESLKNAFLLVLRDSDSVILHDQHRSAVLQQHPHTHPAAFIGVAYGIFAEIVHQFIHHIPVCPKLTGLPFVLQGHSPLLGTDPEIAYTIPGHLIQIQRLIGGSLLPVVNLRQTDNVVN